MEQSATAQTQTRRSGTDGTLTEIRRLLGLGLPMAGTQLAFMMLGVVDTVMLGHFDATALAAAGIGNMWHWAFTAFAVGLVFGVEALISQSYGRGDKAAVALSLQRGLVIAALASVPVCICQSLAEPALLALGQDPEVAELAGLYCIVRLPCVPAFLAFMALRVFLQGRNIVWPAFWIAVAGNALNAALNYVLIYGAGPVRALGLFGAALATTVTALLLPVGLALWIKFARLSEGYQRPWDRESFSREGLKQVLRQGVPIGIQTALEGWAFALSMGLAGWLGVKSLAAHQVILNLAALLFMVPLGLSIGVATRVGNLLGAGELERARQSMKLGFGLAAAWAVVSGLALFALRGAIPRIFTSDPGVILAAVAALPFVAGFQLFDATQAVGAAVLRAMGHPRAGALVNVLGFFVVALPLAYYWALPLGGGVPALWAAFAVGLGLVAVGVTAWALMLSRRTLSELTLRPALETSHEAL